MTVQKCCLTLGWDTIGWDSISPDVQSLGIDLSPVGEKYNLTPHWGRDKGIPSECPRFAIHDEACRVVDVANLGQEDGIPESLPQCGDWLFFSFLPENMQNMFKTHTRRDFSRLFGVDVLWRHRWIISGMGLSHPPGWDNISPVVKIGGYSCPKSEKKWSLSGAPLCWRHKNLEKWKWKKRFINISFMLTPNCYFLLLGTRCDKCMYSC